MRKDSIVSVFRWPFGCLIAFIMVQFSCKEPEYIPEPFQPSSHYEAYSIGLAKSGLSETALGKEWMQAGVDAIENPIDIQTPHTEALHFDARRATAYGYKIHAKNGQKVKLSVEKNKGGRAILFFDLFRILNDTLHTVEHIASADTALQQIAFEVYENGTYLLRIQSELLRGGNYTFYTRIVPSLEFPIVRGDNNDIGGRFGDPRDGGKRKHHGIDIFAKRHTPIIAPTDGYIRFAGAREGLGGNVIWMGDEHRHQTLYFAHLQDVMAESKTYVQRGDTIGTVGNSGNAIHTAPHLHFGIYSDGPQDPYPYVALVNNRKHKIQGEYQLLGKALIINAKENQIIGITKNKYRLLEENGAFVSVNKSEIHQNLLP